MLNQVTLRSQRRRTDVVCCCEEEVEKGEVVPRCYPPISQAAATSDLDIAKNAPILLTIDRHTPQTRDSFIGGLEG